MFVVAVGEQDLGSTGGGGNVQRRRLPFLRLGYIAFFVQEEFRDIPMPVSQRNAERPFTVDKFVDVRAGTYVFSDRLKISCGDRWMQRQFRTGTSAPFPQEFGDVLAVVL